MHHVTTWQCVQLANGVRALLIHDPLGDARSPEFRALKAALNTGAGARGYGRAISPTPYDDTAVAVATRPGTFADPATLPGAAHFLEHLLFLGSARFPESTDMEAWFQRHGGSELDAHTEADGIYVYGDVDDDGLAGALRRLAAALAAPRLAPRQIANEVRLRVHAKLIETALAALLMLELTAPALLCILSAAGLGPRAWCCAAPTSCKADCGMRTRRHSMYRLCLHTAALLALAYCHVV